MSVLDVRRTGAADYGRYIKALITGSPGAGKTLFSSTFPNPLFLITEPGLMSVADRNVPYIAITSSDHLMTIKKALEQSPKVRATQFGLQVDTVVIDTTDELQQLLIVERLKDIKKDSLTLQDYGWLKERTAAILKGFRNLDMHVIFTSHLKDSHDDITGVTYRKPGLTGSICDEIAGYVDLAVLLKAQPGVEIINKESVRVINRFIQTFPDTQHDWIKDRSGKLPHEFKVDFVDDFNRMERCIYGAAVPVAVVSPGLEVSHTKPAEAADEPAAGNLSVAAPQTAPEAAGGPSAVGEYSAAIISVKSVVNSTF